MSQELTKKLTELGMATELAKVVAEAIAAGQTNGGGGVTSVNHQPPDNDGNVTLAAANLPDVATKAQGDKADKAVQPGAIPAATPTVVGGVKQHAAIANLAADPKMADYNALLAALRQAGLLAT